MIIETSDNRFYRVAETGSQDLAHVWNGYPVKRVKAGKFYRWDFTTAGRRAHEANKPELIRKAGSRVVEA